ncbi:hypothetical protein D1953_10845 [Peribacillus asahii]|uniref:Integrase n=1 Tax=Peribacillus asahii TaxID=228899 RepID=A0A398BCD6_9BACI|nr:hypothetical protein [Peribacillus asahii]RID85313.1 hypothetical protein D1953_10845 [Peribacillus asahii]USK59393.1 hypothetical protein LIT37_19835 [Peribacillus asahii]
MAIESVDVMEQLLNNIQDYNDSRYNLEYSIEEAKEILEEEINRRELSECYFENDTWYLERYLIGKRRIIDFSKITEVIQFNKNINAIEFTNIVKCWTASLIEEGYSSETVGDMVQLGLRGFLILTKGLTETNHEELADELINLSISKLGYICSSALNFFDYYTDFEAEEYVSLLYSVRKHYKAKARLLPPSKDILIFSKVLEDYFSNEISELQYRRWFPIWLWWNLTTLIPIRPSEFCTIERECLIKKDANFYIKLPRHKQKLNNKKHIQIIDELKIPEELYRKIEEYKHRTESFGKTDTLISYLSIPHFVNRKYVSTFHHTRLNPHKYSLHIFRRHLEVFYEEVVFGEYNVRLSEGASSIDELSITQRLLPGDTRHLAFLNLNRQGYHPVEIARLGGHVSIHSQNHYFNHVQSFVDLEILELITNVELDGYQNKMTDTDSKQEQAISMSFIEKYVLRPSRTDFKLKLIDGYCTDAYQRCKVEDCWECDAWRISEEEFHEKKDTLSRKLVNSESEINQVIANLKDLYKGIYVNGKDEFYSSDSPEIRKELINKAKRIDNAIRKYVNLVKVKERIDSIGNKG